MALDHRGLRWVMQLLAMECTPGKQYKAALRRRLTFHRCQSDAHRRNFNRTSLSSETSTELTASNSNVKPPTENLR